MAPPRVKHYIEYKLFLQARGYKMRASDNGSRESSVRLMMARHWPTWLVLTLGAGLAAPAFALPYNGDFAEEGTRLELELRDSAWSQGPLARPSFEERNALRVAALEPGVVFMAPLLEQPEAKRRWRSNDAAGIFWFCLFVFLMAGSAVRLELKEKRRDQLRKRLTDFYGG